LFLGSFDVGSDTTPCIAKPHLGRFSRHRQAVLHHHLSSFAQLAGTQVHHHKGDDRYTLDGPCLHCNSNNHNTLVQLWLSPL
jgi:hypothetical protein